MFGKYLGWIIGLLYILYFLNTAADNIRDLGWGSYCFHRH
ncbi:GerAB/ArcD/ProY family transporter [Ectobacillus funiculus]|uniref:GerAB/ArcD/ProY family transporter n=1 Tax=Ectobacillus funiculus TaxID=137993 RepID=A0ABV5WFG1_9BACI